MTNIILRNPRPIRSVAITAVLCTALFALAFMRADRALASGCRTDPVVVLSNGMQLQFGADINTSYSNVHSVVYTIHGPARSAPVLIVYTDNPIGSVERVVYYGDLTTSNYSIDTVVYTGSGKAGMTASGLLVNALR